VSEATNVVHLGVLGHEVQRVGHYSRYRLASILGECGLQTGFLDAKLMEKVRILFLLGIKGFHALLERRYGARV